MLKNAKNSVCATYMFEESKTNWTNASDVKEKLTYVDFSNPETITAGGLPIISDGKTGYIDASDNHCAIFGASGFKKSTCGFMPLIGTVACASENMVVLDPKGELYTRSAAFLKEKGYHIILLNFRDFNADGYNPFQFPAKLWRESGDTDKATSVVNDFASALALKQEDNQRVDPFWPSTAKAYINGVLPMMFDSYKYIDDINILSLANYFTEEGSELLRRYILNSDINNAAVTNIKTVLSEPDKTRMSTLATCSSFIQAFIQNDKLCRMLSHSTFELEDLAKEKTALFMITDDTTTVCDPIVAILISQLQTVLVDRAYRSPGGKLKTRVNFILDEMCSLPINLTNALATHRSRGIRYFLCIQSIDALKGRYPQYESLLTNCATTLFLGSTEMELLETISKRCGETHRNRNGATKPLISVPELMTLRKTWDEKEAIYMNLSESIRYCATLPAIEQYEAFCSKGTATMPNIVHPPVNVYTFKHLHRDIRDGKARHPFSEKTASEDPKSDVFEGFFNLDDIFND